MIEAMPGARCREVRYLRTDSLMTQVERPQARLFVEACGAFVDTRRAPGCGQRQA
jgi:hypothetical protein